MEIARNLCITEYPPFCPVALRHRELLPHHQTPALQKLLGFLAVLVTMGYGPISPFPMNHPKWLLAVGWNSTEQTRNITNCHCCLAENRFCHHHNHGHHHPPIWGENTAPSSPSISSFSVPHLSAAPVGRPPWLHQSCYAAAAGSVEAVPPLRPPGETPRRSRALKGSSKGKKNEKGMKKDEKGT